MQTAPMGDKTFVVSICNYLIQLDPNLKVTATTSEFRVRELYTLCQNVCALNVNDVPIVDHYTFIPAQVADDILEKLVFQRELFGAWATHWHFFSARLRHVERAQARRDARRRLRRHQASACGQCAAENQR